MKKLVQTLSTLTPHWVGDGFPVRSIFNYSEHARDFSPFLLLDYAAPYKFTPTDEPRGVGEHPHRGFETVTIVYSGEVSHRDSFGGGGTIGPGDVQWMTAGGGLVHEEFHSKDFTAKGGTMEMVQLWVNLPKKDKLTKPKYQGINNSQIPEVKFEGGSVRVIAGQFQNGKGPANTFSPINLWDVRAKKGATINFEVPKDHTAALLVLDGKMRVDGKSHQSGEIALLERAGTNVSFEAEEDSKILFLGGEVLPDPVVGYGPFVMTSESEIRQEFADYQKGLMGSIPPLE